jgi:hypothetical protein
MFKLIAGWLAIPLLIWLVLANAGSSQSLYPEFSSLRSDENGTLVFYESLQKTGFFQVERNFRPMGQAHIAGATVLAIGVPLTSVAQTNKPISDCEAVAHNGNRCVVILQPSAFMVGTPKKTGWYPFENRGVHLVWKKETDAGADVASWSASFDAGPEWQVLKRRDGQAVAIERSMLVLALDSGRFTNLGMLKQRDSELAVTLLGRHQRVVFDESHLGVVETGTLLGLARHYRLQGFLAGLLVLCILFLWRNGSAFPPVAELEAAPQPVDAISTLAGLLERGLPRNQLIEECVRARMESDNSASRSAMLQETMREHAGERDIVRLFQLLQIS